MRTPQTISKFLLTVTTSLCLTAPFPHPAAAHDSTVTLAGNTENGAETKASASAHAPIGVMGDHMHHKGEWMLGARYMHMEMSGNRNGTSNLSNDYITANIANRFYGVAGQPATLRVVPENMSIDMEMFSAMYAPSDWLTLMIMSNFIQKDMRLITYAGMTGTNILGHFNTHSAGWGDTKLTGEFRLYDDAVNHVQINLGVSVPTGSIKKTGQALAPSGMSMNMRLPYAMQLGTGTYDALPGIGYNGHKDKWRWGAQYSAEIPLDSQNDEGYRWGDKHSLTAWGSYEWAQWISTSARLTGTTQGKIKGIDPAIIAPVQTADPENYGGKELNLSLGVNLIGIRGPLTDQRLAIEATAPLYRDLNGPQMEKDWSLMIGWQYAF